MNGHSETPSTELSTLVKHTFLPRLEPGTSPTDGRDGKGKTKGGEKPRGKAAKETETAPSKVTRLPYRGEIPIGSIIEICWWDARAFAVDWQDHTDDTDLDRMPTISVGYLTRHTNDDICIVQMINTDTLGHGLTIPLGCIHIINILRAATS